MTAIDVYRATTENDEYGDPKPADWSLWASFTGKVGWGNPDEPLEAGSNVVITNRTVFIRSSTESGIRASDRVRIAGIEYEIDGAVAEWGDPHVGTQFALKAAS